MIRRPPRSTQSRSSAASDVYKRQQKRYPEVPADGEPLAIRANRHHGVVHGAVARVENVAILVSQSAALHVPDERDAEHRRILAVIHASGADRIELVLGPWKHLGDGTLICLLYTSPSPRD